jgi:hypothetical protein
MKESVGNDKYSVKLLETHNVIVEKTPELSTMRVRSEPLFGGEMAIFLMASLSALMAFLSSTDDKALVSSSGFYAVILIMVLLFASLFRKRILTTTLDAAKKRIMFNKAGIFGTALFSSQKEFSQTEIKQIIVERFAKGYFGGYGVQIRSTAGDKVFITNQNLELEDAKKCADGVREFINLEEKILVTG